ncbi:hypothetical protein HK405_011673, partial [Cladochytrium tenue]
MALAASHLSHLDAQTSAPRSSVAPLPNLFHSLYAQFYGPTHTLVTASVTHFTTTNDGKQPFTLRSAVPNFNIDADFLSPASLAPLRILLPPDNGDADRLHPTLRPYTQTTAGTAFPGQRPEIGALLGVRDLTGSTGSVHRMTRVNLRAAAARTAADSAGILLEDDLYDGGIDEDPSDSFGAIVTTTSTSTVTHDDSDLAFPAGPITVVVGGRGLDLAVDPSVVVVVGDDASSPILRPPNDLPPPLPPLPPPPPALTGTANTRRGSATGSIRKAVHVPMDLMHRAATRSESRRRQPLRSNRVSIVAPKESPLQLARGDPGPSTYAHSAGSANGNSLPLLPSPPMLLDSQRPTASHSTKPTADPRAAAVISYTETGGCEASLDALGPADSLGHAAAFRERLRRLNTQLGVAFHASLAPAETTEVAAVQSTAGMTPQSESTKPSPSSLAQPPLRTSSTSTGTAVASAPSADTAAELQQEAVLRSLIDCRQAGINRVVFGNRFVGLDTCFRDPALERAYLAARRSAFWSRAQRNAVKAILVQALLFAAAVINLNLIDPDAGPIRGKDYPMWFWYFTAVLNFGCMLVLAAVAAACAAIQPPPLEWQRRHCVLTAVTTAAGAAFAVAHPSALYQHYLMTTFLIPFTVNVFLLSLLPLRFSHRAAIFLASSLAFGVYNSITIFSPWMVTFLPALVGTLSVFITAAREVLDRVNYLIDIALGLQSQLVRTEIARSDRLLKTILPPRIIRMLLSNHKAVLFEEFRVATVLHMDIAG